MEKIQDNALQSALNKAIAASSISELAAKLNFDSTIFSNTVKDFNELAKLGKDYSFSRNGQTMTPLADGQIYAIKLQPAALNTQGGPRRNEKAEVLKPDSSAIKGLYSAGEAGSITTNQYQAGQDVAELLIFGKIAGENVAQEPGEKVENVAPLDPKILASDEQTENYQLGANQFLGKSDQGMGNEFVVKVTMDKNNQNIQDINVIKQSETKEIGQKIIKPLLHNIIESNSTNIDAVSGS